MKAINTHNNYLVFAIEQIGQGAFHSLIKQALGLSDNVLIDERLNYSQQPKYTTQFPFYSGFIQNRFAYDINDELAELINMELITTDVYDRFFCEYTCWDFYQVHTSVLSINIVLGIVSVNSEVIDLKKYGYEEQ